MAEEPLADTVFYDMKRPGQLNLLPGEVRKAIKDAVVVATGDVVETEHEPADIADTRRSFHVRRRVPLFTPLGDVHKGLTPFLPAARKRLQAHRHIHTGRLAVNLNALSDDARTRLGEKFQSVQGFVPGKSPEPDCYKDYGFRDLSDFCTNVESGIVTADKPLEVVLGFDED